MLYERYLKIKQQRASLHRKLEQARWKQNAEIKIRDLIMYPDNAAFSYGEANYDSIYSQNSLDRLYAHLASLVNLANQYHETAYCALTEDGSYQLKPEHKNTITRLSTAEFSFYGKAPLTPAEFSDLVDKLYHLLQNSHDNVHLLLSSIPVVNENSEILNVALYLQAGKYPKIDTVTKGVASDVDVMYANTENYAQQQVGEQTTVVSSFMGGTKKGVSVIANNSVIEIETAGGAQFTQFIDICLDHYNQHSRRLFAQNLNAIDTTRFIPEQVDHIVTANSINVFKTASMTPDVLHIDPRQDHKKQSKDKNLMLKETVMLVDRTQYQQIEMRQYRGQLVVKKPPFGPDYYVQICKERSLEGFVPELLPEIEAVNEAIMQKRLDDMIAKNLNSYESKDFDSLHDANKKITHAANKLVDMLEQSCKPNFFEAWLKIGNYQLKKEIQTLLDQSKYMLMDITTEQKDTLHLITPWVNDLLFHLNSVDKEIFSFYFLYSMKSDIKQFQSDIASWVLESVDEGYCVQKPG